MKYLFAILSLVIFQTAFSHVKFSEAERTIIRLQDERRGIDTIASYLDSKVENVTWRAAIALANIADTSSRRALIKQLSKEIRPHAIRGIAFALGVLGADHASFAALKKVISREQSNELFIALARTVPKEQAGEFASILSDPKVDQLFIASALVEIGLRKLIDEQFASFVDKLEKNDNSEVRWQAIYSFARNGDSLVLNNHLSIIKEYLYDIGSPESRMFAASALGRVHNADAGKMLIDAARSETEWRVQVNILNAMGKMPRFSSAIFGIFKKAVDESIADSGITYHVARTALEALDQMIEAGKLTTPDSVTVAQWLSEYIPAHGLHLEQSSGIHSQALVSYTRLAPIMKDNYLGVASYISASNRTDFIHACTTLGLIPDTGAFEVLIREVLKNTEGIIPYVLDGLQSSWELAKKTPAYYAQLEKTRLAAGYRHMLIRFPSQTDNIALVTKTMESLRDIRIVTDSLRPETEEYLLEYLYKYGVKRYQDQLLPILGTIAWLKPANDSFAVKLTEIMNTAADEWGNKQIADMAYRALIAIGKNVQPPVVKIIRQPINWDEIEKMPDTLILQSKYGFVFIKLNTFEAPLSAHNMYKLSKESYFVFNYINRLVPNFVIQSGDMTGTGYGGPGYSIRTEIAPLRYDSLGVCGMASDGKDTEGSQWFITHCPTPHLNTRYSIWGEVAIGKEHLEKFQWNEKIDNLIPYR